MNKTVIVLVLTTVAASLACMHLVSELRDERERAESLQTQITGLERALAERQKVASATPARETPFSPFSTATTVAHDPKPQSRAVATPSAAPERRTASIPPDMREHFDRQRKLMQDPKYREAMRKQQRVHMDGMYPGLEEALGLSAEDKSRFLDLLSQHRADEMAAGSEMMAWDQNDSEAMKKAHDAFAQRQQRYDQDIDAQFGSNVRQKWAEYQESIGARHRLGTMQTQLALSGAPLDAEQSKAVLNALVDEQRRQMQEHFGGNGARSSVRYSPAGGPASPQDWSVAEWTQNQERAHERMLSSLQSTLTPKQIEHIEGIFTREREAHRASMELMQAQGVNGGNTIITSEGFTVPAVGFSLSRVETTEIEDPSEQ